MDHVAPLRSGADLHVYRSRTLLLRLAYCPSLVLDNGQSKLGDVRLDMLGTSRSNTQDMNVRHWEGHTGGWFGPQ